VEHAKASNRSKVEHVFHAVKNLFRHRKCRYKGLAKKTAQLHVLFAIAIWCCSSERCASGTVQLRPEGEKSGQGPPKSSRISSSG
jgi:hypothetical protein